MFFKNVLLVMSGTGIAQVISVAFSPALSRLYGPSDFGVFGSFLSIVAVLGAVVTLQFAEALMLPREDLVAARLMAAAFASTVVLSVITVLLLLIFPNLWFRLLNIPELKGWLWLIPLAAVLAGFNQSLSAWCARLKAFKLSAGAQVIRSLLASGGQTGAGAAGCGAGGLIAGNLIGDFLSCAWLIHRMPRKGLVVPRHLGGTRTIVATAQRFRDFPLYSAPQNLLNAVSQGAPVILLMHYYGAAMGGIYAFSVRVLQVPMSFVLTALRQVLFQRLSEIFNTGGNLTSAFRKGTLGLLGIASLPAIAGALFAPRLFAFVFGTEWFEAGECARWLLVWLVPGFCNLPAALVARILRKQKLLLIFDIGLLIARLATLVLGGFYLGAMPTIAAFSIVGAVFNLGLIAWVWWLTKKVHRSPDQVALPGEAETACRELG